MTGFAVVRAGVEPGIVGTAATEADFNLLRDIAPKLPVFQVER